MSQHIFCGHEILYEGPPVRQEDAVMQTNMIFRRMISEHDKRITAGKPNVGFRMVAFPFFLLFLISLVSGFVPIFVEPVQASGSLIVDPAHPQWFKHDGGSSFFLCGPGDPENFLYRGSRNPDGTRNGDQMTLINKLVANGGNSIYFQMYRVPPGDGDATHNPFVNDDPSQGLNNAVLNQWETWFDAMDQAGILIYAFPLSTKINPGEGRTDLLPKRKDNSDETTNFAQMSPRDDLAFDGTQYVLADPATESYILYASALSGQIGVRNIGSGTYDFRPNTYRA